MQLIDTHTHLYQPAFQDDIQNVIARCRDNAINKLYLPAIDSESHVLMLRLEEKYSDICVAMMGLHPCSIKKDYKKELSEIEFYLSKRSWCAIGEIGLDFYWDKTFISQQYEAFELQIKWAKELNIPVIIHTRNATSEAIEVIAKHKDSRLRGVFHCFSGDFHQAQQVIDLGFYLGIGGVVTFKNSGMDKVIEKISLEHLVLETDAPYLAPVPYRGKRNEPSYLTIIAQKIADLHQTSWENVAVHTTQNAINIFVR